MNSMYYPKTLSRFSPKVDQPICLKALAADAALKTLVFSCLNPVIPNKTGNIGLDGRGRRALRRYLDDSLPRNLHTTLFNRAVEKWYGAERIFGLMQVLNPIVVSQERVDLIGPFRYAYGCYFSENRLYWSNGTIERLNLTAHQCDQLFHKMIHRSPKYLRYFSISTQKPALKKSKLPSILARAEVLRSVVILNGATDHILRILGMNCPLIQFVDISHSQSVSDQGLRNLLLKQPRTSVGPNAITRFQILNPCAKSLTRIIILGTDISTLGHEFASTTLNGYSLTFIPDSMIFRPSEKLKVNGFLMDTGNFLISNEIARHLEIPRDEAECIQRTTTRFIDSGHPLDLESLHIIDYYSDKKDEGQIFIRTLDSRIPQAYLKLEWNTLTQLILPWTSFTWRIPSLPDLTELANCLPNLTVLKARLQGVWESNGLMWPHLRETYIWTINDSTVLSFLQNCPGIEIFKFNCLDFTHMLNNNNDPVPVNQDGSVLNDVSLREALVRNISLRKSLVEISLRPAMNLSEASVRFLIRYCPRLQRLGDMESWQLSPEQLKQFNKVLDRNNSKCVLTVLSFPPANEAQYLL